MNKTGCKMGYQSDRQWTEQFTPEICRLVGQYVIEPAPVEFDIEQATDLVTLQAKNLMIAARVRRPGFLDKYFHQFTIRSRRDNGTQTELAKIINGWGDLLFYAHSDREKNLPVWWLIDLRSFRAHLINRTQQISLGEVDNRDGTWFMAFDIRRFPPEPPILKGSYLDATHPLRDRPPSPARSLFGR